MKNYRKHFAGLFSFVAAFLFLILQGCDTTDTNGSTVSLSFAPNSGVRKISQDFQLTEVKILLRDIKLRREENDDDMDKGNHDGDDSDCEGLRMEPIVVNLNLNGVTTDFVVTNLPAGTYDALKFEIHKPGGSEIPPDPEFKDSIDNSKRYSVVVKGMIDGTNFVYKSRKSAHQKVEFNPPLVVVENSNTNLTIVVDPYSWFYEGDVFLDPTDPANENDIDNNIKDSFKQCFKDDDHDGDND